jgi:hypothetical protein
MTETALVSAVLLALGQRTDLRVWRQNTGALKDSNGRLVRYGLVGSGDISGILAGGRRLEIECKVGKGRQSEHQRAFGEMIQRYGGVYLVVRSVEDAVDGVTVFGEA